MLGPIAVMPGAGSRLGPANEGAPILAVGIPLDHVAGIRRGKRQSGGVNGIDASSAASTS